MAGYRQTLRPVSLMDMGHGFGKGILYTRIARSQSGSAGRSPDCLLRATCPQQGISEIIPGLRIVWIQ